MIKSGFLPLLSLAMALVFSLAPSVTAAPSPSPTASPRIIEEPTAPPESGTLSDGGCTIPVYKKNVRIPFRWTPMSGVESYQYKIIDMSQNKTVKNVRTKKNAGFMPKNLNTKAETYKVIIYGLDKDKQQIKDFYWIFYFHTEKIVHSPSGKRTCGGIIDWPTDRDIFLGEDYGNNIFLGADEVAEVYMPNEP